MRRRSNTCIAALVHDGSVWMGGDAAGTDYDLGLRVGVEPKVWVNGPVVFGACGSFRVSQLLRHHLTVPVPDDDNVLQWVTGPFMDAMRETLRAGGSLTTWDTTSTEELTDSGFLVGVHGRLFDIYEDFGVGEYVEGYAAIGCGGDFALGSMFATPKLAPKKRITLALEAAEKFSAGVQGPFTIEKV